MPLKLNKATGKESNSTAAFSELNWGTATHDYHLSIKKHGLQYTADIIIMACQFLKDQNLQASIKNDMAGGLRMLPWRVSMHCSVSVILLLLALLTCFNRISAASCYFLPVKSVPPIPMSHYFQ